MTPIESLKVESGDSLGFGRLAQEAKEFLLSQGWCRQIRKGYLDIGWEGILGVFLFEFEPAHPEIDDTVWIVVGDLPPAYICNDNPNGASALHGYVTEMLKWVEAVKTGRPVDSLIPVNVEPAREYAEMLESRLNFIENRLLPEYKHLLDRRPLANE